MHKGGNQKEGKGSPRWSVNTNACGPESREHSKGGYISPTISGVPNAYCGDTKRRAVGPLVGRCD